MKSYPLKHLSKTHAWIAMILISLLWVGVTLWLKSQDIPPPFIWSLNILGSALMLFLLAHFFFAQKEPKLVLADSYITFPSNSILPIRDIQINYSSIKNIYCYRYGRIRILISFWRYYDFRIEQKEDNGIDEEIYNFINEKINPNARLDKDATKKTMSKSTKIFANISLFLTFAIFPFLYYIGPYTRNKQIEQLNKGPTITVRGEFIEHNRNGKGLPSIQIRFPVKDQMREVEFVHDRSIDYSFGKLEIEYLESDPSIFRLGNDPKSPKKVSGEN